MRAVRRSVGQQEKWVATRGFQTGNISSLQRLVHGYSLLRLPSPPATACKPSLQRLFPPMTGQFPRDCQVRPGPRSLTKTKDRQGLSTSFNSLEEEEQRKHASRNDYAHLPSQTARTLPR